MNVFDTTKRWNWLVIFAIAAVTVISPRAHALWKYSMKASVAPHITRTKTLTSPTVAEIQNALAPNTLLVIRGTVRPFGRTLYIEEDDVRLDFSQAAEVVWVGEDTWDGFLNISARRVRIEGLRFRVSGSGGRCRGITIFTPSTDIRIANCTFKWVADGLVADGNWARVVVRNTKFLNCTNWADDNLPGGYGIFMEDDDNSRDDLWLLGVTITLHSNSGQHGIRLSQVQRVRIDNCVVTANQKRSLWAYGVDCMAVTRSTFRRGSMLFNLTPDEWYTDRPTSRVRLDRLRIEHTGILEPIDVYCGHGSRHITMRDIDVTSTSSSKWIGIGWRGDGNPESEFIRWINGSITFNGNVVNGHQHAEISDWSSAEQNVANIGPIYN